MKMKYLICCCIVMAVCGGAAFSQGKTSMEYLGEASQFYAAGEFKNAIVPFEKALELEKKGRKLKKELWFVLVDNLAISYGITGEIAKSQAVLEYGIKLEPTYPMFYYNMACGYGETDDEANATKYLQLAFKYKENMIGGEIFPDPETDSSFKRLLKRETFKKALAAMKA